LAVALVVVALVVVALVGVGGHGSDGGDLVFMVVVMSIV
jgi:hypothetical protein